MRHRPFAILGLLPILAACMRYEPGPPAKSLGAADSGRLYFESLDPFDFVGMTDGSAKSVVGVGDLEFPNGAARSRGLVPAVIVLHGSGGVSLRHRRRASELRKLGFATFVIDTFTPRNLMSSIYDQAQVSSQGMTADVYAALRLLATHPRLDGKRIGIMGFSKGGIVATYASVERLANFYDALSGGHRFAFAIAYYPLCQLNLDTKDRLAGSLLLLLGEKDDYTPPEPCVRMANSLKRRGQSIEYELYPGAYHGFDGTGSLRFLSGAVTVRDSSDCCRVFVDAKGATRTLQSKQSLSTVSERIAYLRSCAVRGVRVGGNAAARRASWDRIKAFVGPFIR